jgi:hypothetical protein
MQVHLFSLDSSRILFSTPLRDICLVVKIFLSLSVGYVDKKNATILAIFVTSEQVFYLE